MLTTPKSGAPGTRPPGGDPSPPAPATGASSPGRPSPGSSGVERDPAAPLDPSVALGYVLVGPLFYGGLGLLLDRWLEVTLFLPVGALAGAAAGVYLMTRRLAR